MCKVGDIIVVENYKSGGKDIGKHSFVVISDEGGEIQGLDYDLICNVMSSFKDERQKTRKLKYEGNFPITHNDTDTNPDSGKDDEWREETEWDTLYEEVSDRGIDTTNPNQTNQN